MMAASITPFPTGLGAKAMEVPEGGMFRLHADTVTSRKCNRGESTEVPTNMAAGAVTGNEDPFRKGSERRLKLMDDSRMAMRVWSGGLRRKTV